MDPNDISQFGKGAVPTPDELKSRNYVLAAAPVPPIDWSVPYYVEDGFTVPQKNQLSSLDCTCEATNYYVQALNRLEHGKDEVYSERYPYSQVHLPGGGAYIPSAMRIPLVQGVASLESVPDGDHTEVTMRDASLNATARIEARADRYAQILNARDIDALANLVRDYHGFVTGFLGNNQMFDPDGTIHVPTSQDWGHAVWVCGYELRNGIKCLKFKNSWGLWGDHGYGYFTEDFIHRGVIFDSYVYADVLDLDPLSMPVTLARDPKSSAPSKVYALLETKKIKLWIVEPRILELGHGDMWGGFDTVIEKDLSGYTEGNIDMAVSQK